LNAALKASESAVRGINPVDKRFRWHVLGHSTSSSLGVDALAINCPDAAEALCIEVEDGKASDELPDNKIAPRPCLPANFFTCLLFDGNVTHDAVFAIQLRIAQLGSNHAKVVIGGSTGMRMEASASCKNTAKLVDTFPTSDIDIDIYVFEDSHKASAVSAIDAACSDIVRDAEFERKCANRLPKGVTMSGCRTNSRVYAQNGGGSVVSVDVPSMSDATPRMRHRGVFATRNDTLSDMVLHRIRLSIKSTGGPDPLPRSVPVVDIKTRVGVAPRTVERRYAGLRIRVPSAQSSMRELERLLGREYSGVDEAKDALRRKQLEYFRRRDVP
jgi:hypothetical protein